MIEAADYPPRFALRLAQKEAELIIASATACGVPLQIVAAVRSWLESADDKDAGRDYTAVLAHILAVGEGRRASA